MNIHFNRSPVVKFLFENTKISVFWLVLRLYVGYEWVTAGWGKLMGDGWVGINSGKAIGGFVQGALAKTAGAHPDVFGWYGTFLEKVVLAYPSEWAHAITYGEIAVGVALILGAFTGIAAFFGLFMNLNFMLAGTAGINPILFVIQLFLVLAWRTAGYLGLDRYLLPKLGTWWQPGSLFRNKNK